MTMDPDIEKHSNPLLPLIVLLMLVILLTLIISNLKPESDKYSIAGFEAKPEPVQFSLDTQVQKISPAAPSSDRDHVIRNAVTNWKAGKIEEAESDFRTILVFDPDNYTALSYLGTIFYDQGKYKEAELLFRKSTERFPDQAFGFRNLGLTLFRLDRVEEAVFEMKRAAALAPMDMENVILLARLYAYIGDQNNAAVCLKRAHQNGVDLTPFLREKVFQSLVKIHPGFPDVQIRESL